MFRINSVPIINSPMNVCSIVVDATISGFQL